MTILHLVTKRQYRGAEVFASELCGMLAKNGHRVIFAGLYAPPAGQELDVPGAVNIDLNGKKSPLHFALVKNVASLIRQYQPDVVQANGSDTLKYAVLAKKWYFPHMPVIYRNISMVSSWARTGSVKRLINRMLFRQVNFVTSVGRQSLEDLIKTYHYPRKKTQVINRGIPEERYDKEASRKMIRDLYGWKQGDPVVMHIGQFSDEKNHGFMVECFARLLQTCPDARLVLIGVGKNLEKVTSQVKQMGLESHIAFAGHRSPVQEWLAGADVFILGSTIEGVPGVVLEAAMQSVPAVAVQVGGVGEVVQDGKTGILLPSHDKQAFIDAMARLLTDAGTRNEYGRNAREFVMEHYSLRSCLHQFEKLYEEVQKSASLKA